MSEPIHIISLGAGVQSSTMALMAAHGEILPMPNCAIFADTQNEPKSVYEWLDWLEPQLPFPVHRVTQGNLAEAALQTGTNPEGKSWMKGLIPAYVSLPNGAVGPLWRTCTAEYKLRPLMAKEKELANVRRAEKNVKVITWIGISTDEAHRMKPSSVKWAEHRWPLIEKRMSRADCRQWVATHGFPNPPRSACVFCPFHNDREWLRLKTDEPREFKEAVYFERRLQSVAKKAGAHRGVVTLHRSGKQLDQIDFDPHANQISLFGNECEGLCGV